MARTPRKTGDGPGAGGAKPVTPRANAAKAPRVGSSSSSRAQGAPSPTTPQVAGSTEGPVPERAPARPSRHAGFLHATGAIAPLAQIERLRTFRPGLRSAEPIASEVERFARELAKHEHAAGGLARSWASLAPQAIQHVTRVDRLHGGVLTVIASDASAKYDAEMWLAEGGLAALRGVAARTLRRVKVVIG